MNKEEAKKVRLLGLGVVILSGHTKGFGFQELDESSNPIEGTKMYFKGNDMSCGAGQIYIATMNETTMFGKHEWVGSHPDKDLRTELLAQSQANLTLLTAYSQQKKAEKSNDDILSCLEPIRRAYLKTNAAGRLALQVRVINYLQSKDKL